METMQLKTFPTAEEIRAISKPYQSLEEVASCIKDIAPTNICYYAKITDDNAAFIEAQGYKVTPIVNSWGDTHKIEW